MRAFICLLATLALPAFAQTPITIRVASPTGDKAAAVVTATPAADAAGVVTRAAGTTSVTGTVTTTPPANASTNVSQINGTTPLMGAGNTGTGSPRVTIASDQVQLPVNAAARTSSSQSEVLVLTASTALSVPAGSRSCEVFNNGPNTIYCNPAGAALLSKSRPIVAATSWSLDVDATAGASLACIAATANQVTTAATILTCIQ